MLEGALTTEFGFTNDPDSAKADKLLESRLRGPKKITELVIVQSPTHKVGNAPFKAKVEELHSAILEIEVQESTDNTAKGDKVVDGGAHYYLTGDESLVSKDRGTTLIPFVMAGELVDATDNAEQILETVREANGKDGFTVLVAGESSIAFEANEVSAKDIEKGERIGVPMALLILVVLFGTLLAALIPVFLAIISNIVALGATALVGQFFELIFFVTLMITMIGLAVGIDYSLIVVSRYREERRQGRTRLDAITRTGATACRTVFFSGVTVVLALSGMLIIPSNIFQSLAIGAILVVIAAMMASLTLLPAVLALLGDKVNLLRVPIIGRQIDRPISSSPQKGGGFWDWTTRTVMRFPVISIVVVAGLMLVAASSYLDMDTGFNGVDTLPDGVQAKDAFEVLEEKFSFGVVSPAEIVIDGDIDSEPVKQAIEELKGLLAKDERFLAGQTTSEVNPNRGLALLGVPVAGEFSSESAVRTIGDLRDDYIPQAFAGVDAEVLVTGPTAFNLDFFELVDTFTPIIIAVVLSLSFILLTVAFRSLVVPIKAIIMNLLSVGTAYGLMVLVFQKGVGADLLGFQQSPIIDAWIPLFLFSVLFGLSMDYHVFLLSRIRERYDETKDNAGAVAYGLRSTAGLITGAALIMVAVFGGFASGETVSNQQVGFGLAAAVFLDATLVRTVLVPASMRLLGPINWYFPAWLEWLPDLRVEAEQPAEAPRLDEGPGYRVCRVEAFLGRTKHPARRGVGRKGADRASLRPSERDVTKTVLTSHYHG